MRVAAFGWRSWATFAAALAILLGLGTWQLQRKVWKEQLLREITLRAHLPPLDLARDEPDCQPDAGLSDPCEFKPVVVTGATFKSDVTRNIFISVPRQPDGIGGPGYWVFAPIVISAQVPIVIAVNCGFVPEPEKARGCPPTLVSFTGVLRRAEARITFAGKNDPAKNIYYVRAPTELWTDAERAKLAADWRDAPTTALTPARMARREQLLNLYYIDRTGPVIAGSLPVPLAGKIAIPNRHLEYALTWYALAATLVGIIIAMSRRRND